MADIHKHRQTTKVINRLSRIEGHIGAIKRMLKEGKPCPEVLVQMAAVKAAITQASRVVLKDHLESCLYNAVEGSTPDHEWQSLTEALDRYMD